jgi:D-amino-acid dehydrogenase
VDSSGEVHEYTARLAGVAREAGVDLRCGRRVEVLQVEAGRVTGLLLDSGEEVRADLYVLAAGVASPQLAAQAGVNLPVYPLKGHMATVRVRGQPLARNVYSPRQGLLSPLSGGRVRVAGMVEAVGWDHAIEEDKGRRVLDSVRELFRPGTLEVGGLPSQACYSIS